LTTWGGVGLKSDATFWNVDEPLFVDANDADDEDTSLDLLDSTCLLKMPLNALGVDSGRFWGEFAFSPESTVSSVMAGITVFVMTISV